MKSSMISGLANILSFFLDKGFTVTGLLFLFWWFDTFFGWNLTRLFTPAISDLPPALTKHLFLYKFSIEFAILSTLSLWQHPFPFPRTPLVLILQKRWGGHAKIMVHCWLDNNTFRVILKIARILICQNGTFIVHQPQEHNNSFITLKRELRWKRPIHHHSSPKERSSESLP